MTPYWGAFYLKTRKPLFGDFHTEVDVDLISKALKPLPPGRVLDLGCGHGRHIHAVSKSVGRPVLGVDFDAESLSEARLAGCEVLRADVCDLPFDDKSVAGAYSWSNTPYCFSFEMRERMFAEVGRVLVKRGRFVCQSLAPDIAKTIASNGESSAPLGDGTVLKEEPTWDGEKLHLVCTHIKVDGSQEQSEISISCPSDDLLLGELKAHGMKVVSLHHHEQSWQRILTAMKT